MSFTSFIVIGVALNIALIIWCSLVAWHDYLDDLRDEQDDENCT